MELSIRKADGNIRLASCKTEEILDKWITVDPAMLKMKDIVRKIQPEDDAVLIVGPTGTGKEMLAQALHGSRIGKFVPVNCTALPSELLESELFGHKKGAFTGADSDRVGKFQSAFGGTLFLDEIGDMPLMMQAKLLRVLQEKKVTQLGNDGAEIDVKCRVVAATNLSLDELIGYTLYESGELPRYIPGRLRLDLYYRIAIFVIQTTALSDRLEDVPHIVDELGGHELVTKGIKIDISGNVRSIQAQIRRYQVLGDTSV